MLALGWFVVDPWLTAGMAGGAAATMTASWLGASRARVGETSPGFTPTTAPPAGHAAPVDRLHEVTIEAMAMRLEGLDRHLGETRADLAEVLATLDRALAARAPETVLRRELVELRELVRLGVYTDLPSQPLPLGDVVAEVVAAGVSPGRVCVTGSLPTVVAPSPLAEALVRSVLGWALAAGDHPVEVGGRLDGAMIVLEVRGVPPGGTSIHSTIARRAVSILGGEVIPAPGVLTVIVPARFVAGLRAVSSPLWDLPEAI